MPSNGSAESRQMARRLIARATAGVTDDGALGPAMQRAYERVSDNLRDAVGADGYTALLARALSRSQAEQPVLQEIRRVDGSHIHLDVAAGVDGHGVTAVRGALETLLTAIVDILSDLIGADMVRNLLDHSSSDDAPDGGRPQ